MKYENAPADYPYFPSRYVPSQESIDSYKARRPNATEEEVVTMLRGGAASCFLDDFPKEENPESSVERATAIAWVGKAQLFFQK